jgi:hypothetical protein
MDDFKKYLNQHRDNLDTDIPGDHLWEKLRKELENTKEVGMNPAKGRVVPMVIRWAAAACVILLAGFGAYVLITQDNKKEDVAQSEAPAKVDTISKPIEKPQPPVEIQEAQRSIAMNEPPARKHEKATVALQDLAVSNAEKQAEEAPRKMADPMAKVFSDMEASYASMVSMQMEKIKGTPIYAEDANYFHVFKKQFQDLNNDEKLLKDETKKNGISDDIITRMINIYQEKITLLKQLQFEINKMNNRVKNSDTDVQKQTPTYINL